VLDRLDCAAFTPASDATLAAAILAVDPAGIGGVALRGRAGGAREAWLGLLRALLPSGTQLKRLPSHITDDRLLGGLDLAATLAAGRPVVDRGILAETDGGILLLPLAERMSSAVAARIVAAMDKGEVSIERDGAARRLPARFGLVALDEGVSDEERPPSSLIDRIACHLRLDEIDGADIVSTLSDSDIAQAGSKASRVVVSDDVVTALCNVATMLGIASLSAPILATRVARCAAALDRADSVMDQHAALAARLVLAPRAVIVPLDDCNESPTTPDPEPPEMDSERRQPTQAELQEIVLAAVRATIPPGLLAQLGKGRGARVRASAPGRAGDRQHATRRGRPSGIRRGALRAGARLNVLETLRASAPWQGLRRRTAVPSTNGRRRIEVRTDDFRIQHLKDRRETVTVFVVDTSGSSALHRLAEAKGAVELLLADCYVRRDQVSLLSFGGRGSELLLPPTRSLTRAKRRLADVPGGGGTPLAEALEQTALLVRSIKRRRQTPAVVVLTDGRPNLSRDGSRGRQAAQEDAVAAARALREAGIKALLIDTSPRAEPCAARIAEAMGAQYVPLPYADALAVSKEVRARIRSQT